MPSAPPATYGVRMVRLGRVLPALLLAATPFAFAAPASAAQDVRVSISFTGPKNGQPIRTPANEGSAATSQSVVIGGSGRAVARWSHINTGIAARLPAFDGGAGGARAIVAVTNSGDTDGLTPGADVFSFGADARLDDASQGTSYDNGNNVVQRGLVTDAAQFKLQLDDRHFSCRMQGDDGLLTVSSTLKVATRTWYHAYCKRVVTTSGDYLLLSVAKIRSDGTRARPRRNFSSTGPCGNLTFALATPLSVGGKLVDASTIAPATDQFNGLIDSVFLKVG